MGAPRDMTPRMDRGTPVEARHTFRVPQSIVAVKDRDRRPRLEAGRQVSPSAHVSLWQDGISRRHAGRDTATLNAIRIARDFDPQASQAVWNFLRLLNPGHDLKAYVRGGDGSEQEEAGNGQVLLDQLARTVSNEYGGGLDQLHDVMALMLLTSGAVAGEVEPNEAGNEVVDWHPVEPALLTFKRVRADDGSMYADGTPRTVQQLGQVDQQGIWRELPAEQVFYQPLDPDVGDPYGRPPLLAMLQTVIAKAQLLTDLRAVAHNQGFPRLDVKVVWESLLKRAPAEIAEKGDEKALDDWATKMLRQIATDYEALQVDDTFVHYDFVEVKMTEGGGGSFDFGALEQVLTAQLNSSVKQLPILMGQGDASAQAGAYGGVQWNVQVLGIRALRRHVKRMIERMANVTLRIAGVPAFAKVEYDDLRTTDRLYEAQAETLEGKALEQDVRMGWRTNDQAAEIRAGQKAVADPQLTGVVPPGDVGPGQPVGEITPGSTQETNIAAASVQQWSAEWDDYVLREPEPAPRPRRRQRTMRHEPARMPNSDEYVEKYEKAAGVLFMQAMDDLIELLKLEGVIERSVARDVGDLLDEDLALEIADEVFGLGYRRQMKGLLRQAVAQGVAIGGGSRAPESVVNSIWRQNDPFVTKIRDDLSQAIFGREIRSPEDAAQWFAQNSYREDMMGRFLGKQGLEHGWAYAREEVNPGVLFRWQLGEAKHCKDCDERDSQLFTYADLQQVGYPGSDSLDCMGNCQCELVEELVAGELHELPGVYWEPDESVIELRPSEDVHRLPAGFDPGVTGAKLDKLQAEYKKQRADIAATYQQKEHALLITKDGKAIRHTSGSAGHVKLDGPLAGKLEGGWMMHNHPGGAPLSPTDLLTMSSSKLAGIESVYGGVSFRAMPGPTLTNYGPAQYQRELQAIQNDVNRDLKVLSKTDKALMGAKETTKWMHDTGGNAALKGYKRLADDGWITLDAVRSP